MKIRLRTRKFNLQSRGGVGEVSTKTLLSDGQTQGSPGHPSPSSIKEVLPRTWGSVKGLYFTNIYLFVGMARATKETL